MTAPVPPDPVASRWASPRMGQSGTGLRIPHLGSALSKARLPALGLALGLAALAQTLADRRIALGLALAAYLLGAILYALAARPLSRAGELPASPAPLRVHFPYLLWALVFAGLAFAGLRHNRVTFQGLLAWAIGVALCFSALRVDGTGPSLWRRVVAALAPGRWRIPWTTWGLVAAILLGAYLRLYRLLELPADLGWDLPYNYSDAQRILGGEYLIFFPDNMGREGMFFYLIAAVARLGKLSPYSMRITSALVGIATIPALYALARECADRETATYAAFLLAANKWHIALTRSGYRVSLMPLFAILALYGLARGLRRGRARDWAWAGLFLGLGLWTYKAFTFVFPTFILCVGVYALFGLRQRGADNGTLEGQSASPLAPDVWAAPPRRVLLGAGLALLMTVITAVPMIRFMVDSPKVYLERELHAAQLVNESLAGRASWLGNAARNTLTSLLMFHYEGDGNSRFGVPFQRHLGFLSGVLFALGVAAALGRFRRGGNTLLLLALLGLTAPMTVTMLAGEKPNLFRASGTIGPALVLGAMTLRTVRGELAGLAARVPTEWFRVTVDGAAGEKRSVHTVKLNLNLAFLPLLLVALALVGEVRETSRTYFNDFRRIAPDAANYSIALELAKAIIRFEDGPTYVKPWPYWYDGRALAAHLDAAGRSLTGEILDLREDQLPLAGFHGRMLVLLHPEDQESLNTLRSFFPRYALREEHFPGGQVSFLAFTGER